MITAPLGGAPESFDEAQRARWDELVEMYPWLDHSHRLAVERTAVLWARVRREPSPADEKLLQSWVRTLGGTPADISKVKMRNAEKKTSLIA